MLKKFPNIIFSCLKYIHTHLKNSSMTRQSVKLESPKACDWPSRGRAGVAAAWGARGFEFLILWHILKLWGHRVFVLLLTRPDLALNKAVCTGWDTLEWLKFKYTTLQSPSMSVSINYNILTAISIFKQLSHLNFWSFHFLSSILDLHWWWLQFVQLRLSWLKMCSERKKKLQQAWVKISDFITYGQRSPN